VKKNGKLPSRALRARRLSQPKKKNLYNYQLNKNKSQEKYNYFFYVMRLPPGQAAPQLSAR